MPVEQSYSILPITTASVHMKVEDLYRQLSFGELSNLAVAVDGTGTLKESQHARVIHHANEALIRLYSRFMIQEKSVILEVYEDTTQYHLVKKFAETVWQPGDDGHPWIKDAAAPFQEDVIQVLSAYNAYGQALMLNDPSDPNSLMTPKATTLIVPNQEPGVLLDITYQARHPLLVANQLNQEIELPLELHEAMTSYIAAKMYGNMNTPDAQTASLQFQARFQAICDEAVEYNRVSIGGLVRNVKFQNRGWV